MHIKSCCNRCLRERFMNVNMQLLLEFFVIYVLLWKKFNFAYEAPRSFFVSALNMKKKKDRAKLFRDPILEILHEIEQCPAYNSFVLHGIFIIIKKSFIHTPSIFSRISVLQNIVR